ncbi:MAG: DsrE family protein [Desulfohalobiaceae bacterium]
MQKTVLFVFNADDMCFIHVLLNSLDMKEKGHEVGIVIEGAATKLIPELVKEDHPLQELWAKAREQGLVYGACRACSHKMGTLEDARDQGIELLDDMSGHPSMAGFQHSGHEIITF